MPEAYSSSGGGESGKPTKNLEPFSATVQHHALNKSCNVEILVLPFSLTLITLILIADFLRRPPVFRRSHA